MIKIMKYGEVSNSEIFARVNMKTNIEDALNWKKNIIITKISIQEK